MKNQITENLSKCYDIMSDGKYVTPSANFDKVLIEFNKKFIENKIAKEDLTKYVIKPDMKYHDVIKAIKDYFG